VAKKVRGKEPVLDILVGTHGCNWKFSQRWKANSCWPIGSRTIVTLKVTLHMWSQVQLMN